MPVPSSPTIPSLGRASSSRSAINCSEARSISVTMSMSDAFVSASCMSPWCSSTMAAASRATWQARSCNSAGNAETALFTSRASCAHVRSWSATRPWLAGSGSQRLRRRQRRPRPQPRVRRLSRLCSRRCIGVLRTSTRSWRRTRHLPEWRAQRALWPVRLVMPREPQWSRCRLCWPRWQRTGDLVYLSPNRRTVFDHTGVATWAPI